MTDRCEASGLRTVVNDDGRGFCPLCGDDWHVVTKDGRLTPHRRWRNREWTPAQVAARLAGKVVD
jgi:uncharacterized Zn finger protein (UPF0148 family)